MLKLIKENRKREYLELTQCNYSQAVTIINELYPELYDLRDPFFDLYDKAMEYKKSGMVEEEKLTLHTAIISCTKTPYCYERLAILYSKEKEYEKALAVCIKWIDSNLWLIPNCATTSLHLLERKDKLVKRLSG